MKFWKSCAWLPAIALIALPALLAAQAEQATGNQTVPEKVEKKAKAAAKTAEKTTEGAAQKAETTVTGKSKGSAQRAAPTVPESEIAAAKASGKVWVNTDTRVYHKGGKWYGATKHGKFMTEDEAKKAGYRASKGK